MIKNENIIKNSLNRYLNTTPIYSDFKAGLNKFNNQAEIETNELFTADNIILSKDMGLYGRGGVDKLITAQVPYGINSILGLFHARFSKGDKVIVCCGYDVYAWNNNSWTLLTSTLTRTNTPTQYSFAFIDDKLVISDGVNKPFYIEYDGTNFTATELTNAPITKFVCTFYSYLFFSGDTSNKIYFSEVGDITSYPLENCFSVGGSIDNSPITAIIPILGNLVIFKKNSIYYMTGSSDTTFSITQMSNSIGCIVDGCVADAENDAYFFGQNGLYRITSSMSIEYLFTKLQPYVNNINFNIKSKIIFNPYNRQIWFIVGYSTNDYKVFVYDLFVNAFSTYTFYYNQNNINIYPLIPAKYYQNDGIIKIIACNNKDGYVRIYDQDNCTDDGNDIYCELETKLFNLGDPLKYKSVRAYTAFGSSGSIASNSVANSIISYFKPADNTTGTKSYNLNYYTRGCTSDLYNGRIYVIGGYNGSYLNKVQIINLASGSVIDGADMPIPIAYHCSVLCGDKIYIFGGSKAPNIYNKKIYVYDITNNTWSFLDDSHDMPTERIWATATLYNDKVYVIGGYNGSGYLNVNEEFDLITSLWATKTSLSTQRALHCAIINNDRIYIFGGYPNINAANVSYYDITHNNYTSCGDIMPAYLYEHNGIDFGGYGYIFCGYSYMTNKVLKNIYKFDFYTHEFTYVADNPIVNYWFGIAKDNDYIYTIGGYGLFDATIGFKFTNDFYSFTTQTQGMITNSRQVVIGAVSNALYKFISVILKLKIGYTNINIRGFVLDYFLWNRRE